MLAEAPRLKCPENVALGEIKFAPPINAKELIGFQDGENDLPLADIPLHIGKAEIPNGMSYTVVVERPLMPPDLLSVLKTISPHKEFAARTNSAAVRGDWDVVDKKDPKSKEIVSDHTKYLGVAWEIFRLHRPVFLHTLQREYDLEEALARVDRYKTNVYYLFSEARRSLDSSILFSKGHGNKFKKMYSNIFGSPPIGWPWVEEPEMEEHERNLKFLIGILNPLEREELIDEYSSHTFDTLVWNTNPRPGKLEYDHSGIRITPAAQKNRYEVETDDGLYKALAKAGQRKEDSKGTAGLTPIPETIIDLNFLVPVLKIDVRSGKKTLDAFPLSYDNARKIESATASIPNINALPDERKSTLAGAILASLFQPETRINWKPEYKFPDGSVQQMGPAQVPVLLLMDSKRLTQGKFIEKALQYANAHAT